jgi:N-acetylneuraminic acid mutarotase
MFLRLTGARSERGTRMAARIAALLLLTGGLLSLVCGTAEAQVGEWVKGRRMPSARVALVAAAVDGTIYAIGGVGPARNAFLKTVEAYDIEHDDWTPRADIGLGRAAFAAAALQSTILVAGGVSEVGRFTPSVEAHDVETDTWSGRADMTHPPHGRQSLALAVVKQRVYALGGHPGLNLNWGRKAAQVESYDPVLDLWTARADMHTARGALVAGVVNGKICAIGGADDDGVIASTEEYDPVADRWTKKRDMPTARAGASAVVVNGLIYVIGGVDAPGAPSVAVEVYDPSRDRWRRLAGLPNPRSWAAAATHEGLIYLLGGEVGGGLAPILDSVLVYNTGFRGPFSVSPRDSVITTWSTLKVE